MHLNVICKYQRYMIVFCCCCCCFSVKGKGESNIRGTCIYALILINGESRARLKKKNDVTARRPQLLRTRLLLSLGKSCHSSGNPSGKSPRKGGVGTTNNPQG
ncbi:hypothetical protein, unlikely [Trypanosoma brucei gambiense DAL972]|uniref:Uncharacterized protein n=1 Tax=Trypanosoma brucei gambiense (strain MHOM/CI/86/DAL972) TaxID=679716 RepID=D0A9J1_TRYB9|nr:hypothetical protein, unlikely [Trypanosoma brucei gambiense DAL972]CBH18342.1 hypothetical protein, unlikely [Trypanosoma brucei gambiense DAL972]|eukprot:XP_011780606.1 hypothetical protein, unlikely [Trypanosoma brucei gambiense DAL972]